MESKMLERFRRECVSANELLLKLMNLDKLSTVDYTLVEDGIGVISGFNRSMKYLFGPELLQELEKRCNTDDSARQSSLTVKQEDEVENISADIKNLEIVENKSSNNAISTALNNEIKNPISSNNHKNVLNVQNDFFNKNFSNEGNENWILASSKESLPEQPKLEKCVPTFCFITHVEHPGKFYISPNTVYDIYASPLLEMNDFYEENIITVRINVVVKEVYAFYFENRWVRALVRNIVNEDLVELFLIDYGSETIAECLKLFPLKSEFKKIIPLAYECQLANVSPVDSNGLWSKKAINYFKEECFNTCCTVIVLSDNDNGSLNVLLNVNDKPIYFDIVRKNFAVLTSTTVTQPIETKTTPTSMKNDAPKLLKRGMTLHGKLSHLINPSHFYVKLSDEPGEKMLTEINDYFKENNKKKDKSEKCSKTLYGALYEGSWQRAIITNELNITDDKVDVTFVDTGITTQLELSKLKPLPEQFCHLSPLAHRCHLHEIIPISGKWISKVINKTKITVLHKNCTITIKDDEDSLSYGVLLLIDGISVNEKIVVKGYGELVKRNDAPIDDIIPEIMNQPMGAEEEDVPLAVAVQGYEANDEAEVCPHYKGPPHTTCFKGPRCKKKHQLLNPDGWTIKRIPALMEADQIFPIPNTFINIALTSVINHKSFYGLIIDDVDYFCNNCTTKELGQLQKFLNCSSHLKTLKTYDKVDILPGIGELVAAYFSLDQMWYRAKICAIDENESEVFFIDFGNLSTLRLNQTAVLEKQFSELPPQAMCFLIDNIDLSFESPNVEDACNMLHKLTADKILRGYIESIEAHEVCIRLYDNDQDIGMLMCETGLVEEKQKSSTLFENQPISEDAVRLYCQLENIEREDFCYSQRIRLLPG